MNSFTLMEFISVVVFIVIALIVFQSLFKRVFKARINTQKVDDTEFCHRCGATLCSQSCVTEWTCPNCKCQKRDMHA